MERSSTVAPRCHAGGYPVEWQTLGPGIRQRTEQDLAVILRDDPAVEENDRTVVGFRADEATEALAQAQRGLRQLKLHERIVVALGPTLNERIVGHAERKPRDHDAAEHVARQVYPLPERLRAEENGSALCEALEERATRAVDALCEHREAIRLERAELRGRLAQRGV